MGIPDDNFTRMLGHARAWAREHGDLAAPRDATHGGHPVGRWLGECRRKAKQGRLAAGRALDRSPRPPHGRISPRRSFC
ncbi:helicase associated domain-containing protein [Streptomyces sp. NPDC057460]|uniref:helicase associated domain-containing protein n=1 Tax=Streptomyces sp. NPDC057460 TaxID=3346141 RepID=UPI0036B98A43